MSDDQTKCTCGCTESQHEFEHEESHYPESRTVFNWQACEAHNCMCFRPSLPWPDDSGLWWSTFDIHDSRRAAVEDGIVYFGGMGRKEFERTYGPASFTRLLETNPYREGSTDAK